MPYLQKIIHKSSRISWTLFKLMIPIIIVMKVLQEYGIIELLSGLLAPVMELVGLPGAMGLVWATAMLTNLYGGIIVYAGLAADVPMTVAQVTLVSSMMLIAHGLPLEARIAQKAGVSMAWTLLFRIGMAVLFAVIFNQIYLLGDWLQQPAVLLWSPEPVDSAFTAWILDQLYSLLIIFIIVVALVLLLDILQRLGIIQWINAQLRPVLHLLGIGREAETIALVGLTLGISYGGALLIDEAEAGHIQPRDVLFSISLLGLSHSLIEDTLLMMLIGADLTGILLGRVLFTLVVIYLMVKLLQVAHINRMEKYLVRPVC